MTTLSEALPDPTLPQPGELLAGKYRIERLLGKGGMGVVYSAHHELLGVRVAVKLLLSDIASSQESVGRFLNEARNAARIQSENVARVMDVGTLESGRPFMVIEYLDGDDLSRVLEARGQLPLQEAVDYALQALEALAQAHVMGIVHRDLKPANLFLVKRQDRTSQVKVLDFGISKSTDAIGQSGSMTSTKSMLGSPYYMSPEQLRSSKNVDARADIWSMGIILYELVTGAPPFLAETFGELFANILEQDPPPLRNKRPDLPLQFEAVVLRCLRRRADERFPNVGALASALAPFASPRGQRTAQRILDVVPAEGGAPPGSSYPGSDPHPGPVSPGAMTGLPFSQTPSNPSVLRGTGPSGASGPVGAASTNGSWGPGTTGNIARRNPGMVALIGGSATVVLGLTLVLGFLVYQRRQAPVAGPDPSGVAAAETHATPSAAPTTPPTPSAAAIDTAAPTTASTAPSASATTTAHVATTTSARSGTSPHASGASTTRATSTTATAGKTPTAATAYDPSKDSRR